MILNEETGKYTKSLEVTGVNNLIVRDSMKSNKKQHFKIVKGNSGEGTNAIYIESLYNKGRFVNYNK